MRARGELTERERELVGQLYASGMGVRSIQRQLLVGIGAKVTEKAIALAIGKLRSRGDAQALAASRQRGKRYFKEPEGRCVGGYYGKK